MARSGPKDPDFTKLGRSKEGVIEARSLPRLAMFQRHRAVLFSIAYRMLGSVADAEDMLQETFIRWQQCSDVEVKSPQAFLVTVISRLCINHLQSARVRREQYVGQWLPEPLLTGAEGSSDAQSAVDESLSMAFLLLLERLTPTERAVFVLRDVFDYDYCDIARIVGHNVPNCRQVLRRARQHIAADRPRFDSSPQQREALLREFLRATADGDLEELIALLAEDAVLHSDGGGQAPALPKQIHGADKVARGLIGARKKFVPPHLVNRITEINGELGVVSYLAEHPYSVVSLDLSAGRVRHIYIVSNPEKLARLPPLPSSRADHGA
jgi:RNA polymerase sigma-70 factor, ECF subfamily